MTTKLGPWDVGFPVRFRANGDTVHDAFYKHIQEIERIYGLLNALDSNKLDWSDMQSHINSPNPHPNLTIDGSKITGTIDASKIRGLLTNATISIDNVIGNIPASRVYGLLENATIDSSHVNGLSDMLKKVTEGAQPIEDESGAANGYVKFKGGFMIQWGTTADMTDKDEEKHTQSFPTPFSSACYSVTISMGVDDINSVDFVTQVLSWTNSDFTYCRNSFPYSSSGVSRLHFIAVGK